VVVVVVPLNLWMVSLLNNSNGILCPVMKSCLSGFLCIKNGFVVVVVVAVVVVVVLTVVASA